VGGAAAVLDAPSRRRVAALAVLLVGVGVYTAFGDVLPELSTNADVAFIAVLVIPAVFAFIWLTLPWHDAPGLAVAAVAFSALAFLLWLAGFDTLFDLAKLAALTAIGFWFLTVFEALSWVVLIAVVIPWVDAFSVARGPTEYVVREQPGFFEEIAFAFRVPGEDAFAHLGPPDVVFFALFVAAAARFGLRPGWTWVAMTALLGLTLMLTVWVDVAGLPALPAIALGFLLPNADLLWSRWREHRHRHRARESDAT
jgi:hypothetical protein